ncbi:hypothetical protein [Pseudomonas sp. Sample_24]|uniref:hypothetical protein n=1 Tax=Pseudomonas sp. Sample_24 TaxID=2448268 RepID=UPI001032DE91|nr:hypothetical protein [Pseudomonas sp. Sample_24]
MDWMQFVAAITSSLAWPIAAVAVVLSVKRPLLALLPKIRTLKYGDLQIDLEEQLKAVQADLTTDTSVSSGATPPVVSAATVQLAAIAPRAAILYSWSEVESALDSAIDKLGWRFEPKYDSPIHKLWLLREKGHIDELTASTFKRLMKIRNEAAHIQELQLEEDEALSMSASCAWLIERIQAIEHNEELPVEGEEEENLPV